MKIQNSTTFTNVYVYLKFNLYLTSNNNNYSPGHHLDPFRWFRLDLPGSHLSIMGSKVEYEKRAHFMFNLWFMGRLGNKHSNVDLRFVDGNRKQFQGFCPLYISITPPQIMLCFSVIRFFLSGIFGLMAEFLSFNMSR